MVRLLTYIFLFLAPAPPALAIVGATAAKDPDGVRRHTVAIVFERGLCSGVLIARDRILTAAHCFNRTKPRHVVALDRRFKPRFLKIAGVQPHSSFQHAKLPVDSSGVDLAIVRLENPVPADMEPAMIGNFGERGDVFLAGFGVGDSSGARAGVLRGAFLRARIVDWKSHRLIAAVGSDGERAKIGTGGCRGDSGGPIYAVDSGAVVGIVSWSSGAPGRPGACGGLTIATEIGDHRAWIVSMAR